MAETDFDGNELVVLPGNYLQSPQAVSEIYENDLAHVATNLDVDTFSRKTGFFHGTLLASLLWAIPSCWTLCY